MAEPTNKDRAEWAYDSLGTFMERTGCDIEDALADLLCDLMHYADQHGYDFNVELLRADGHYLEEKSEEEQS